MTLITLNGLAAGHAKKKRQGSRSRRQQFEDSRRQQKAAEGFCSSSTEVFVFWADIKNVRTTVRTIANYLQLTGSKFMD